MSETSKPMTAKQFNDALKTLGLSVYASPKVLGISLRQSQRYSSGEQPVAQPVANQLRLLLWQVEDLLTRLKEQQAGIVLIESGVTRYHSGKTDTTNDVLRDLKRQLSETEKLLADLPFDVKPKSD